MTMRKHTPVANMNEPDVIFETAIRDWRIAELGTENVSPDQRGEFTLKLGRISDTQFYLEIAPKEEGKHPALEAFIEINEGVPCLHLANEVLAGDNQAHVYALKEGLAIAPDGEPVDTIDSKRIYPHLHAFNVPLYR